ncbi:MAG: diguanylate cyclase and metal dependent phosphohydrolase [Firmicutes bacterium]|nr:diguanylate cyclase and metal dependent phosphohydrolase [Bacillota bacterium]
MSFASKYHNKPFFNPKTTQYAMLDFFLFFGAVSIYGIYLFMDLPAGNYQAAILLMLVLLLSAYPKRKTPIAYCFVIPALIIHHGLLIAMHSMPFIKPEHITLLIFFAGVLYAPSLPDFFIPILASASLAFHFVLYDTEAEAAVVVGKILGVILLAVFVVMYAQVIRRVTKERDHFYHASILDSLTGLYNFTYISEVAQQWLDVRKNFTILFIDLDNFKNMNDTYGHMAGNQMLIQFARNLEEVVDKNTVIGRLGGDEFVLLLTGDNKEQPSVEEIVKELSSKKYITDSKLIPIPLEFSYGIAEPGEKSTANVEELFRSADKAMYCNKFLRNTNWYSETDEIGMDKCFQVLMKVLTEKDMYTYVHSLHVAQYSALLAEKIGLSPDNVEDFRLAGLLHDIGKLAIPSEILRKPDKLSDYEYGVIKHHVVNGLNLLKQNNISDIVRDAIAHHHEHYNGNGYPYGCSGEKIPLAGRILAIADAYSAMVVKRLYREQSSRKEALHELTRNKNIQFDPKLVDIFLTLFDVETE